MLFGAHISISGGVFNAPLNSAAIGGQVFQMFTRSPQGGFVPELTPEVIVLFKKNMSRAKQQECYVHAPYFINFASANPRIKHASISVIRQELERSSLLGAKYLMAHLGSYKNLGHDAGLKQVVNSLEKTLNGYKGATKFLIEISAGAGQIIGGTFEGIAEIINNPKLKKYNIGVCFDTQHAFASGYNLRTPEAVINTLKQFDQIIGLNKLKMSHCNDSMTELGSNRDRHEHIGDGKIGLAGFKAILNNKDFKKINFICETEGEGVKKDIKLLKKISNSLRPPSPTRGGAVGGV